ncbi:MAG: hypothetical protein V4684_01605 [Pseudomonadota bacterium]
MSNQLFIDGTPIRGTRRWESSIISALIEGGHSTAATACGATEMNALLATQGQQVPLTRKQWSLILQSLIGMFSVAGRGDALAIRLRHGPRAATVGPWWWEPQPGDKITLTGSAVTVQPLPLPGLSFESSTDRTAALCQGLLVCQSFVSEGQLEAALDALSDGEAWHSSTPELQVLLKLRVAEVQMLRRDFEHARVALDEAQFLIDTVEVAAAYLGSSLSLLRHRIAYAQDPIGAYPSILGILSSQLRRHQFGQVREVDTRSRGLSLNLAALCERRWIEENARRQPRALVLQHAAAALRFWSAALFCFASSNQHEHVQNMCSNIGYFHQRLCDVGVNDDPAEALAWYSLAQAWHNRFDLPDNTVWEYVFIGDFWLGRKDVREMVREAQNRGSWSGRNPSSLDFYEFAASRAREIGEPRQIAHTALNLWRFVREGGSFALIRGARTKLEQILSAHPSLRVLLIAEGYGLPEAHRSGSTDTNASGGKQTDEAGESRFKTDHKNEQGRAAQG